MNIFILSKDAKEAAQLQCDSHVVKMTLESVQLLNNMHQNGPYKKTHIKHPCSIWLSESISNYHWLFAHAIALAEEYKFRYKREHACMSILDLLAKQGEPDLPDIGLTPFALAMPANFKKQCPVESYRSYYRYKKYLLNRFTYTGRSMPEFLIEI